MLESMKDRKAVIKRTVTELGQYNRPITTTKVIAEFYCHLAQESTSTAQLIVQKENTTGYSIFADPEDAEIVEAGDIVLLYRLDNNGEPITSTEIKAFADQPLYKRSFIKIGLVSSTEL